MTESRSKSRLLIIISVGAVVAIAAVVAVGLAIAPAPQQEQTRPAPTLSPEPTVPPTPVPSIIPETCDEIYTHDWASELAPYVLNPAWTKQDPGIGTNDQQLRQLLAPNVQLTCHWGKPSGGSDVGLITSLAQIDAQTDSAVRTRLNELGWTCYDSDGGVRCVMEGSDPNGSWGESHFIKDGVWVATRWSNLAPDGYTADIVSTLWN